MRRREFITLVGGVAVAWPLVARAQEPGRIYRLAFLIPSPRQAPATIAFFDELRRNGFSEGQNLVVIPDGFEADISLAMEHALLICIVSGRELRRECFAARILPTFRCSNRTGSSWLSISRPQRQLELRCPQP